MFIIIVYYFKLLGGISVYVCRFIQVIQGAGTPTITRMPISTPTELLEEEPLYVNAKQYHRILKRRQARARLEAEGRIPKERPVGYLEKPFGWVKMSFLKMKFITTFFFCNL